MNQIYQTFLVECEKVRNENPEIKDEQEIQDIAAAMKEVGNQIDDIPAALAGKKRKGRKTKK